MRGNGQPHADCDDACNERSDHRDDLHQAGKGSNEEPVRKADCPESRREERRNDDDENSLPAHERSEPQVDELPGVSHRLSLRPGQDRTDDVDRAITLDDQ
jgi:hypothetical protein